MQYTETPRAGCTVLNAPYEQPDMRPQAYAFVTWAMQYIEGKLQEAGVAVEFVNVETEMADRQFQLRFDMLVNGVRT